MVKKEALKEKKTKEKVKKLEKKTIKASPASTPKKKGKKKPEDYPSPKVSRKKLPPKKRNRNNIRDMYEVLPIENNIEYYNPKADDYGIKHPFQIVCSGRTGSKKTSCITDLIARLECFHHIYVCAKKPDEPLYSGLKRLLGDTITLTTNPEDLPILGKRKKEDDEPEDAKESDDEDASDKESGDDEEEIEIKLPRKHPVGEQICIIFDDFMSDIKSHLKIIPYFSQGRKDNISCVWISQSYYRTPHDIRQNMSHLILKAVPQSRDLNRIVSEICDDIEPAQIVKIVRAIEKEPDSFFLVDTMAGKGKRFRKGFLEYFDL